MDKKAKIEKILQKASLQFASLSLPQAEIKIKLGTQLEMVTSSEEIRYNISKDLFKLKLYKFATLSFGIVIIILLSGTGISSAANRAIPGDWLFPLDKQFENVHVFITRNPEKLSKLRLLILQERADEWQEIKNKQDCTILANWQKKSIQELQNSYAQSLKVFQQQKIKYEQNELIVGPKMQEFEHGLDQLGEMHNFIRQEINGRAVNAIYLNNNY